MQIPILNSDYRRATAHEADIFLRNRYFEQTPTDPVTQSVLLSRPAMKKWLEVGDGPIRCVFSQPGSFDDAIFVISADTLFRIDRDETITEIGSGFFDITPGAVCSMTATGNINAVPAYLFIADGRNLWVYDETATPMLSTVTVPDDVGIVSVATIQSFVICVCAQGSGVNGRFYWIQPGEKVIDPLDFATAERSPDSVYQVIVVGDQFWLPGEETCEVWQVLGDETGIPMQRVQGIVFDRGVWQGTAISVKDTMVLVGADGVVYSIAGGVQRISNSSVEERIRKAMQSQSDWQFNSGVY